MSERQQTLEGYQSSPEPFIISKEQVPSWLKEILDTPIEGDYTKIPYGERKGTTFTDKDGRTWSIDDIRFKDPFRNHIHHKRLEIIYIKGGQATIKLGGKVIPEDGKLILSNFKHSFEIKAENVVVIPPETAQGVEITESPLDTRVVMFPPYDKSDSLSIEVASQ